MLSTGRVTALAAGGLLALLPVRIEASERYSVTGMVAGPGIPADSFEVPVVVTWEKDARGVGTLGIPELGTFRAVPDPGTPLFRITEVVKGGETRITLIDASSVITPRGVRLWAGIPIEEGRKLIRIHLAIERTEAGMPPRRITLDAFGTQLRSGETPYDVPDLPLVDPRFLYRPSPGRGGTAVTPDG
jgi:hypothetical protein